MERGYMVSCHNKDSFFLKQTNNLFFITRQFSTNRGVQIICFVK